MNPKTHLKANPRILGTPLTIEDGVRSEVELVATKEMAVDEQNLVHGGFTYSLADYAAMLAVNHPYVVLGGSESRFLAPVKIGDRMLARADVAGENRNRRDVNVEVLVGEVKVFTGSFKCYVLEKHVLVK